jgi:hypothetical protein
MKFGVFDHMDDAGVPLGRLHADRLRVVEAYDCAGLYGYHLAEHHSDAARQRASPGLFLAAVAQRTNRLRFRPMASARCSNAAVPSRASIGNYPPTFDELAALDNGIAGSPRTVRDFSSRRLRRPAPITSCCGSPSAT